MSDAELKLIADQLRNRNNSKFQMPLHTWVPAPVLRQRPVGRRIRDALVRLLRAIAKQRTIHVQTGVATCRFYGLMPCSPRRGLLGVWHHWMRDRQTSTLIPPKRVDAILCADIKSGIALRFRHRSRDRIDYYNIISSPPLSMISRRTIDFARSEAYHHLLYTEAAPGQPAAGRAIGVRLVRNALVLYEMLGITRVRLRAGLDAGGGVWPKFGFKPVSDAEWRRVHPHIRARVQALPEPMRSAVSRRIEPFLAHPGANMIFVISGLADPMPPPSQRTLGEYLLGGSAWDGVLDLEDPNSRALFAGYFRYKNLDSVAGWVAHWRSYPA